MMTKEDRDLVDVFMKAQAEPTGRIFSENVLAGIKAVLAYKKSSRIMEAIELGGFLIVAMYMVGAAVGAICAWAVLTS